MKKIILTIACSFFFLGVEAWADPHFDEAIKHASAAAQANDNAGIIEHSLAALEHTMSGALTAKGLVKTHTDEATKALESAVDQAKAKKLEAASAAAKSAVDHLKAANKK